MIHNYTNRISISARASAYKGKTEHIWLKYILLIILYVFVFEFSRAEFVPTEVYIAAILLAAICGFPIARWYAKQEQHMPMFELLCLAYGLQYSYPVAMQFNQIRLRGQQTPLSWNNTFDTLLLTMLGVTMMIGCYYLVHQRKFIPSLPTLDLQLRPNRRQVYIALSLFIGLSVGILRTSGLTPALNSGSGAFISLMVSQTNVALTLLAYYVYSKKLPGFRWVLSLYLVLGLAVILGLTTGMVESTIIPLVLIFCVRWRVNRAFPWQLVVVGLIIFITIHPIKFAYRAQAWERGNTSVLSPLERINLWVDLGVRSFEQTISGDGKGTAPFDKTVIRQSMSRFDLLHNFVLVYSMTPGLLPYYEGSSYNYLLIGWIPRFLWPDKPIAQEANNIFAVDYGFLYSSQIGSTMTGIGHIAEAYANFGPIGVMVVMGIQGTIFALMSRILNSKESEGGFAIYLSIMVLFLNGIGSATAAFFAVLVQTVAIQALFTRIFATGFSFKPVSTNRAVTHLYSKKG